MTQGLLPFKYETDKLPTGLTALAGLPAYLDLAKLFQLSESVAVHVNARCNGQGWTDGEMVMNLVLLQIAGGDCVDDLRILEGDEGFCRVLEQVELELMGLPRAERRRQQLRWRKAKRRAVPSPSSTFRFLEAFKVDESGRGKGKAWIPGDSAALKGLRWVNRDLVAGIDAKNPQTGATLDIDATLTEVYKKDALHSYKGFKAYQPLNVYWYEHAVVLRSEFREGNVPAGYDILRVTREALEDLPTGVQTVFLRSDSAAYQSDYLLWLAKGGFERFDTIQFSISIDVVPAFRAEVAKVQEKDWKPVVKPVPGKNGKPVLEKDGHPKMEETRHEYAEVGYVPNWLAHSKNNPELRFLAIRERLNEADQLMLPGVEAAQIELPFPVMDCPKGRYKLHGIITNRLTMPASELILWHRERCGKSEEAHAVMKDDLAGGKLPSSGFGQNAAWWAIMIIAFNLNSAMRRLVLRGDWTNVRLKTLRFKFICLAGRVLEHARQMIIRLAQSHPSIAVLMGARERMVQLAGST
jgi:hypothetical protein